MSAAPVARFDRVGSWFRSNRMLALCGSLGLLVTVGAATAGTARFTGPRWLPDWHSTVPAPALRRGSLRTQLKLPPPGSDSRGSYLHLGTVLLWVLAAVGVAATAYLTSRLITGRTSRRTSRRPDVSVTAASAAVEEPEPQAPVIRRGVEQALQLLSGDRPPGDAVMLAWLGLEQSAEDSGIVRKPAETPTELTSRILRRVLVDDRAVATLLALYLRARFSEYEVTAADVTRAREALEGLVRSWVVETGAPGRGRRRGLPR